MLVDYDMVVQLLNEHYNEVWKKGNSKCFFIYTPDRELTKREFELILINNAIEFTNDKTSYSTFMATIINKFKIIYKPSINNNANKNGKLLADAGERSVIRSLNTDINIALDTKEPIFIKDEKLFDRWKNTFKKSKIAIKDIVMGDISEYDALHDGTDTSQFTKILKQFVTGNPNSWNPADIYILSKSKKDYILNTLSDVLDSELNRKQEIIEFNNAFYKLHLDGLLYPISLKQILTEKATIEYTNIPNSIQKINEIEIEKFNLNMSMDTLEVGLFKFKNVTYNKIINMQIRGCPHKYSTAQTEITHDGSPTGGRVGKVPTGVMDSIQESYNSYRIKNVVSFFGKKPNYFGLFDQKKIDDLLMWYEICRNHPKVVEMYPITDIKTYFMDMVEIAKTNIDIAETLAIKIQGLKQMEFFISNEPNISDIMDRMIKGARKEGRDNGFFIKIS